MGTVDSLFFALTVAVPENKALAAVTRGDLYRGSLLWASYLAKWTGWNHIRTVAALAAAAAFTIALVY